MKRNLLFCLACWLTGTALMAGPIDLNTAKKIAAPFMSEGTAPTPVSGSVTKRSATGDAPLYIFNRGNNQGYVIVSGDECMPEILGYTESGEFDADNMAPGFKAWLDYYSETIAAAQEAGAPAMVNKRAVTNREDIPALMTSHWKQDWPYNNMAPWRSDDPNSRSLTGCVATAGAQVAYYWRNECYDRVQYATPTYSYGSPVTVSIPAGTPYKWELLKDSYGSGTPADYVDAVALVNYVMGTSAYLTYGSSTGGHIEKLVFSGQFGLHHSEASKDAMTQEAYEQLLYDNLYMGRPVVYSGYDENYGNGHAIVIDGYRAKDNMFRFNFGWGGNSDGYYTVVEGVGNVGGHSYGQCIIHNIHPMHYNTVAKMEIEEAGVRMYNPVNIEVQNTSPGKLKGFYLFAIKDNGEEPERPTDLEKATTEDVKTYVEGHSTANISLRFRPLTDGTYHLYLLDCNADVLDYKVVEAVDQAPALTLEAWGLTDAACTAATTVTVDGKEQSITYHEIYGDNTTATACISNDATATVTTPTVTYELYRYDSESGSFVKEDDDKVNDVILKKGDKKALTFDLGTLTKETLYAASIQRSYKHTTSTVGQMEAACDTMVYFMMKESDLTLTETGTWTATLNGHWNAEAFTALTAGKGYVYYDMTKVEGVDKIPATDNPNTLFAVAEDCTAEGDNLLRNNVCESLSLTKGYDFYAPEDFTAKSATFHPMLTTTQWDFLAIPFDATVSDGCMARKINLLTAGTISNADSVNITMQRGIPYLFRATQPEEARITATDVTVSATPGSVSDSIRATFVTMEKGADTRLLNKGETQSFTAAQTYVRPFNGYLEYGTDVSASISAYVVKDKANTTLMTTLMEAYDVLDEYEGMVSEEALATYRQELATACHSFTVQPMRSDLIAAGDNLTAAMAAVKQGIVYGGDNETDITEGYITNPSFESKTEGWTIEKVSGQVAKYVKVGSDLEDTMIGLHGNNLFYSYSNKGLGSATMSQTASGLLNGYYRVSAKIASDEGQTVTLFANDRTADMVEDGFGMRYLMETTIDSVKVTNGTLTLGIKGNDGWYKADDFRLVYIGGAETDIQEMAVETQELKVWGEYGCINIRNITHAPVCVNIYTPDGQEVKHLVVRDNARVDGLPRGIYIVNKVKVVVR